MVTESCAPLNTVHGNKELCATVSWTGDTHGETGKERQLADWRERGRLCEEPNQTTGENFVLYKSLNTLCGVFIKTNYIPHCSVFELPNKAYKNISRHSP
jgi:hypothetical protein